MKKIINKANFAIVGLMATMAPAMAAQSGFCDLIAQLGGLLKTLRTLAFIGAGFLIAQWAWEFIAKPDDVKLDTFNKKGVGMLVGFIMLLSIGAVLSFFIGAAAPGGSLDCVEQLRKW